MSAYFTQAIIDSNPYSLLNDDSVQGAKKACESMNRTPQRSISATNPTMSLSKQPLTRGQSKSFDRSRIGSSKTPSSDNTEIGSPKVIKSSLFISAIISFIDNHFKENIDNVSLEFIDSNETLVDYFKDQLKTCKDHKDEQSVAVDVFQGEDFSNENNVSRLETLFSDNKTTTIRVKLNIPEYKNPEMIFYDPDKHDPNQADSEMIQPYGLKINGYSYSILNLRITKSTSDTKPTSYCERLIACIGQLLRNCENNNSEFKTSLV